MHHKKSQRKEIEKILLEIEQDYLKDTNILNGFLALLFCVFIAVLFIVSK